MPQPSPHRRSGSDRDRVLGRCLFAIGLSIGVAMACRSQVAGDQFKFMVLGWELYAHGELLPYGSGMSQGGLLPGPLSSLLSGLPLFLWTDYRAGAFVTLGFHVVAYLLLDRMLRGCVGTRARLLFCILFWLNPWRLYHSAHMWNPNWVFLMSAVHAFSAFRMRGRASFWDTFLHTVSIGLAFQIQGSFLILAVVSSLLWLRGYLRVHWGGLVGGAAVVLATLVPWLIAVAEDPNILPMHDGFIGYGLVTVHPVLKGVSYWLRFPSMMYGRYMSRYDFTPTLGEDADAVLTPILSVITWGIGPLTAALAVLAAVFVWRQSRSVGFGRWPAAAGPRQWLYGFVRWTFVGSLITFALSPTTIMRYQVFIVMHVAVLPMALWLAAVFDETARAAVRIPGTDSGGPPPTRWRRFWRFVSALASWQRGDPRWVARAIRFHVVAVVLMLLAMTLAAPMYRKGGRRARVLIVTEMHPLIGALGIDRGCTVQVDPVWGTPADPLHHANTRRELRERRGN